MRIMKPQFSLATLLVCMTVLAVVAAISTAVPVQWTPAEALARRMTSDGIFLSGWDPPRRANASEVIGRVAIWGLPAIAATFGVLRLIRRLKSRREN
jgi:hypothetical protein